MNIVKFVLACFLSHVSNLSNLGIHCSAFIYIGCAWHLSCHVYLCF